MVEALSLLSLETETRTRTCQYRRLCPTIFVSSDQAFGLLTSDLLYVLNKFSIFYFVLFKKSELAYSRRILQKVLFQKLFFKNAL
jgi:hypothetical protein